MSDYTPYDAYTRREGIERQDATIARLTRELGEARGELTLFKTEHPNKVGSVLLRKVHKLEAKNATLREEVERLRKFEAICHCGEKVSTHTIGMGHDPVEMVEQCPYLARLAAAEKELAERQRKLDLINDWVVKEGCGESRNPLTGEFECLYHYPWICEECPCFEHLNKETKND